jgi:Arc/MetJ family transcription regulator
MAKHLIDLDEETLAAARAELGTATIKETVNEALQRRRRTVGALDILANADLVDRVEAWR